MKEIQNRFLPVFEKAGYYEPMTFFGQEHMSQKQLNHQWKMEDEGR